MASFGESIEASFLGAPPADSPTGQDVLFFRTMGITNPYTVFQMDSRNVQSDVSNYDHCHFANPDDCMLWSGSDASQPLWPWQLSEYNQLTSNQSKGPWSSAAGLPCCDQSYIDGLGGLEAFLSNRFGDYTSDELVTATGCTALGSCSFDWMHEITKNYVMNYCYCDEYPICTLSGLPCCTDPSGNPSGSCTNDLTQLWKALYFARMNYQQIAEPNLFSKTVVPITDIVDYETKAPLKINEVGSIAPDPWGLFIPSSVDDCPASWKTLGQTYKCMPIAVKTGWDPTFKQACCTQDPAKSTLSDATCDPRWAPIDDFGECSDVVEQICTFATGTCGKHVFLCDAETEIPDELQFCKTWYSRLESYDPYVPPQGINPFIAQKYVTLHNIVENYCTANPGAGECACALWQATCSSGAGCALTSGSGNGIAKQTNVYCTNGDNTDGVSDRFSQYTISTLANYRTTGTSASLSVDLFQSACGTCTGGSCAGADSVAQPTMNLGLFPLHCWLPDCQGDTDKELFFDPIAMTIPCPDICAIDSSGLNINIENINANVVDIGNMIEQCSFGQTTQVKGSPIVPFDPCDATPSLTQLSFYMNPGDKTTSSFSVINVAVDPVVASNTNMSITAVSGDLYPLVRVHSLMNDKGESSVTTGITSGQTIWFGVTIDTSVVTINTLTSAGTYEANIYVVDDAGANTAVPISVFVNVAPQTSFQCNDSTSTFEGLSCCKSTPTASPIRLKAKSHKKQSMTAIVTLLIVLLAILMVIAC